MELEEQVKDAIRESLSKRIKGLGNIDNFYSNHDLIERWLTDIMAIGFNKDNLGKAAADIMEIQEPLVGITLSHVSSEEICASVNLSSGRFAEEIGAFIKYVELRKKKSPEVVLEICRMEMEDIEEGDFTLI